MDLVFMRDEMEKLRNEVETTLRACLALRQFRRALNCVKCVDKINENVYFWMNFEHSTQMSMFIGIRRLFDKGDDTFKFQSMIRSCRESIDDFSKDALRKRKMESSENAIEWIDPYIHKAYEPTQEDIDSLSRLVKEKFRPIKDVSLDVATKAFAHAIYLDKKTRSEKLKDLKFRQLEDVLLSVWHVYGQIWQMYENGRKPNLDVQKYRYEKEIMMGVQKQIGCKCTSD